MAWRLLMRRCPTRSMTIVGDLAQTGSLGGVSSWAATLRPYVDDRATIETLTVNYRTPEELMTLAVDVLRAAGVFLEPPTSARTTRWAPVYSRVPAGGLPAAAAGAVREELDLLADGTIAVLCARELRAGVAAAVGERLGGGPDASRVSVLSVGQAKGLEFDSVVLVEPAGIVAASPRGVHDLYVGITRATQRLHVLHTADLPPGF